MRSPKAFFSTLKNELTLQRRYTTRDEASAGIFDYIEMFYNPVHQHSHLQGLSPMQFEKAMRGSPRVRKGLALPPGALQFLRQVRVLCDQ
jgi:transposase InsO family protein